MPTERTRPWALGVCARKSSHRSAAHLLGPRFRARDSRGTTCAVYVAAHELGQVDARVVTTSCARSRLTSAPAQGFTEAGSAYHLAAVVHMRDAGKGHAARHIRDSLLPAVRKALKQRVPRSASAPSGLGMPPTWHSPLQVAFSTVNTGFAKLNGSLDDSIYPHTVVSACLICAKSQVAYSLWYGAGARAPWLSAAGESTKVPVSDKRSSYRVHTSIHEERTVDMAGSHTLVLGSPGLWCAPPTSSWRCVLPWYDGRISAVEGLIRACSL